MSRVSVDHVCSLSAGDAFAKIREMFETNPDLRRLDPNLKCAFNDAAMSGTISGSQFNGSFVVKPEGAVSRVSVSIDLSFGLGLFRGAIQTSMQKRLQMYLPSANS